MSYFFEDFPGIFLALRDIFVRRGDLTRGVLITLDCGQSAPNLRGNSRRSRRVYDIRLCTVLCSLSVMVSIGKRWCNSIYSDA